VWRETWKLEDANLQTTNYKKPKAPSHHKHGSKEFLNFSSFMKQLKRSSQLPAGKIYLENMSGNAFTREA
jgi:hypothetical protein